MSRCARERGKPEVLTYKMFGTAVRELAQVIVDDSGLTLQAVLAWCSGRVAECRSAVLFRQPPSVVGPDYVWRETERWIDFPWSWQGPDSRSAMMSG